MLIGREITVLGAGSAGLPPPPPPARRPGAGAGTGRAITEVGARLRISPSGFAVLDALGLAEKGPVASDAVARREDQHWGGLTGRAVVRMDLEALRPGKDFLLFHQADLIDILSRSGPSSLGSRSGNRGAGDRGRDLCRSMRGWRCRAGPREVRFLVRADGLQSRLRSVLKWPAQAVLYRPGRTAGAGARCRWRRYGSRATVWMGPGRHMVTYPLRRGEISIVAVEGVQGGPTRAGITATTPTCAMPSTAARPAEPARPGRGGAPVGAVPPPGRRPVAPGARGDPRRCGIRPCRSWHRAR
ncbi:MAG: hypothetical protein R3D59_11985 [Paracoccaceae bacterium]